MARQTRQVLEQFIKLDASGDSTPSEFRLFKLGDNKTTKGVFTLTKESAAGCLAAAEEYGNDLSIDYNHAMVIDGGHAPDQSGKAAGWFKLGLRDDGLYAEDVSWTPRAAQMLKDREFRYTSPCFLSTKVESKRLVTQIVNCAVTNTPASHGLTPLVASQHKAHEAEDDEFMRESLAAHLGLGADAAESDVLSAVKANVDANATLTTSLESLKSTVETLTSERDVLAATLADANGRLEALAAKAEADAKNARKAQAQALIDAAVKAGDITPYKRTVLSKRVDDLEFIQELLGDKTVKASAPVEPSAPLAALSGQKWEDLAPMAKHNMFTENPALYTALRTDYLARSGK